jgi:phosphopantetheine--protein transferase-like protein
MSEIVGCGIDIEDLARLKKHIPLNSEPTQFVRMIFTPAEIENHIKTAPAICFPAGFSCKEAIFKAFGQSWTNSPIGWKDIEIIFSDKDNLNDYRVILNNYALQLFVEKKIKKIESCFEVTDHYLVFEAILLK